MIAALVGLGGLGMVLMPRNPVSLTGTPATTDDTLGAKT